jgi:calcium-dependent protein kinase
LFDRIQKAKSFSEADAARLMKQVMSVVAYCHANNIVHRDLKPENILFVSED